MLRISPSDFAAIRCHGEQTYPHECCGILIGTVEDDIRTVLTHSPLQQHLRLSANPLRHRSA